MSSKKDSPHLTLSELAHLGAGKIGYIRKMRYSDASRCFPGASDIDPGMELWALFAADGTPILLTDNRSSTFFRAAEDDLKTVNIH